MNKLLLTLAITGFISLTTGFALSPYTVTYSFPLWLVFGGFGLMLVVGIIEFTRWKPGK